MSRNESSIEKTSPCHSTSPLARPWISNLLPTCCAVIAAVALVSYPAAASDESFVDEFDTFDESRWFVSDGWDNGPHQGCTWDADSVQPRDGFLRLTIEPRTTGDRDFSCGEIQTREFLGYGVYEVRMRALASPGTVSAFFTYTGPVHENPWDEVDIEILGKDTTQAQLNIYVDGEGGQEKLVDLGFDSAEGMNDYAFVWEEDALRWYINGELVREMTSEAQPLPSVRSKLYLSVWNGQGEDMAAWLGAFEPPRGPMRMDISRVAFTAPGDACQFPESIVCAKD
jgi:endo-1,3-1,4-beta-glycanase ExoK